MSQYDVHRVDGVGADRLVQVHRFGRAVSFQDVMQQVPADHRHKSEGHLKRSVLAPLPWQGHVQINLRTARLMFRAEGGGGRSSIGAAGLTPLLATGSGLAV